MNKTVPKNVANALKIHLKNLRTATLRMERETDPLVIKSLEELAQRSHDYGLRNCRDYNCPQLAPYFTETYGKFKQLKKPENDLFPRSIIKYLFR